MGLNWERFSSNFNELMQLDLPNFERGFQTSLNNLSITSHPDFVRCCDHLQQKYARSVMIKPSIVNDPDIFGLDMLPPHYSRYLKEAIDHIDGMKVYDVLDSHATWSNYSNFLRSVQNMLENNNITSEDSKRFRRLRKFLSSMDQTRKMSFYDTFPEMNDFWELVQNA